MRESKKQLRARAEFYERLAEDRRKDIDWYRARRDELLENVIKLGKENKELKKEVEHWKQDCKQSDDKLLRLMDERDQLRQQLVFSTCLNTDNVLYAPEHWRGIQLELARRHNHDLEKTIKKLEDKLYRIGKITEE